MRKLFDFCCNKCDAEFEALVNDDEAATCSACGSEDTQRRVTGGKIFTTIVATTPNSKKYKAGYVHTHADRPKTPGKIQVGYNGGGKDS